MDLDERIERLARLAYEESYRYGGVGGGRWENLTPGVQQMWRDIASVIDNAIEKEIAGEDWGA